jgi:hypothetical protein
MKETKYERRIRFWKTEHEIKFINGLGFHRTDIRAPLSQKTDRETYILKYLESCKNRHNWEDIDKEKAIKYAKGSLDHAV